MPAKPVPVGAGACFGAAFPHPLAARTRAAMHTLRGALMERGFPRRACRNRGTGVESPVVAHPIRRAAVVGAGSFGTAIAVLLERGGVRTTLLCRTQEQADQLERERENKRYLAGVKLPGSLKVRALDAVDGQFRRVDAV